MESITGIPTNQQADNGGVNNKWRIDFWKNQYVSRFPQSVNCFKITTSYRDETIDVARFPQSVKCFQIPTSYSKNKTLAVSRF